MVWISQVIDQDVNIFDGPKLVATSERDLFASGLLPTRTPDDVYRAIVLQRLAELRRRRSARRDAVPHRRHAGAQPAGASSDPDGARGAPAARHRARNRRPRSRRPPRRAVLHPARRGAGPVAGRAHRRSGPPADARDAAHRARRLRCADRRAIRRRAAAARRRVQQHGRRAQGAARRARAHASARGLGRDGAPGGARDQEPADADSAVGRAPAARPRRQGPAARARPRRLRATRSSARCGCSARLRRSSRASPRRRT